MIVCGRRRLDHESRGEGVKLVVVPVDVSHRLSGLDSRSNRLISQALGGGLGGLGRGGVEKKKKHPVSICLEYLSSVCQSCSLFF